MAPKHTWTVRERHFLFIAFSEYDLDAHQAHQLFLHVHGTPEFQPSLVQVRDDYNSRYHAGRSRMWRDQVDRQHYTAQQIRDRNAARGLVQQAAADLGITLPVNNAAGASPTITAAASSADTGPVAPLTASAGSTASAPSAGPIAPTAPTTSASPNALPAPVEPALEALASISSASEAASFSGTKLSYAAQQAKARVDASAIENLGKDAPNSYGGQSGQKLAATGSGRLLKLFEELTLGKPTVAVDEKRDSKQLGGGKGKGKARDDEDDMAIEEEKHGDDGEEEEDAVDAGAEIDSEDGEWKEHTARKGVSAEVSPRATRASRRQSKR